MNKNVLRNVLETLEWYANGNHEATLTGFSSGRPKGRQTVWDKDRAALEALGFAFRVENYDGSENYVENGRKAREAAESLRELLESLEGCAAGCEKLGSRK